MYIVTYIVLYYIISIGIYHYLSIILTGINFIGKYSNVIKYINIVFFGKIFVLIGYKFVYFSKEENV